MLLGDNDGVGKAGARARPSLKSHEELERYLGRYAGLVLYLKEMDESLYAKLCAVSQCTDGYGANSEYCHSGLFFCDQRAPQCPNPVVIHFICQSCKEGCGRRPRTTFANLHGCAIETYSLFYSQNSASRPQARHSRELLAYVERVPSLNPPTSLAKRGTRTRTKATIETLGLLRLVPSPRLWLSIQIALFSSGIRRHPGTVCPADIQRRRIHHWFSSDRRFCSYVCRLHGAW